MKHCLISLLLMFVFGTICAQRNSPVHTGYSTNNIPDTLLKAKYHAIVRNNIMDIELIGLSKVIKRHKVAITVLDKEGVNLGFVALVYSSSFEKVSEIKTAIFDSTGKKIDRSKRSEYEDFPLPTESFQDDLRVRTAIFEGESYPYTVEHTYEVESSESFLLPTWSPYDLSWFPFAETKFGVQHAELIIKVSKNTQLKYKIYNDLPEPAKRNSSNWLSYRWEVNALQSFRLEPLAPSSVYPMVRLSTTDFQIAGSIGSTASWEAFGKWYYDLNKDRDQVSPALQSKILELTKNIEGVPEKAKAVYQFVQDNTRYVSVQLGIGGWQSFPASFVEEKNYGDCKALTNYTYSLLKVAGIKAFPALVRAGSESPDIDAGFVGNQFNHIILCVPNDKDTLWMECTSTKQPFNSLGDFTENRHVLLITPEGGKLTRTPSTHFSRNLQYQRGKLLLTPEGNGLLDLHRMSTGYQADDLRYLESIDGEQQEKWIARKFDFLPSYRLLSYDFKGSGNRDSSVEIKLNFDLPGYATKAASRLVVRPNAINRYTYIPEPVNNRKQPVVLGSPFEDRDTIEILLPETRVVRQVPATTKIETGFGYYELSYELNVEEQRLFCYRIFRMERGSFKAEEYEELRSFLKAVEKADNSQVVLMPGT